MKAQLQAAMAFLQEAGVARPQWTAEQMLARRLGCLPIDLYVPRPALTSEQAVRFQADVAVRAAGMPLQYVLGTADFYGREFQVGPGVFSTRPETEILVEAAADEAEAANDARRSDSLTVVDVGTGCGAIAVTLALERPGIRVMGTDLSAIALRFARQNAEGLGADVGFFQRDLLEGFGPGSVDMVVANLPYLDPAQRLSWPREVGWDPWLALDGGRDGLEVIGKILPQAASVLRAGGKILLEIGHGQASAVEQMARQNQFDLKAVVRDLAGLDRVAVLWKS